jgi:thymidylate synthase
LFNRYERLLPKLRRVRANVHGIYFERMIAGGPGGTENQLEFAIRTYTARPAVRRSVLQIGIFDPGLDHSASALRGFPCLQHVTFVPTRDGLFLNAFYATQYMIERAYGNYLGLCRLGHFVGHELGVPLARVTTFIGLAQRDGQLSGLEPVLAAIRDLQGKEAGGRV